MRKVASYCLQANPSPVPHTVLLPSVRDEMQNWLSAKGTLHEGEEVTTLELNSGEYADFRTSLVEVEDGALQEWVLTEPTVERQFRTTVRVAALNNSSAVSCTLEVGGYGDYIGPVNFDARTPHIVRRLIDLDGIEWSFGSEVIPRGLISARGHSGGERFVERVWNESRSMPVVALSQDHGVMLHPDLGEMLAFDLAGLAAVVKLDPAASWYVTNTRGKEWSVYGGAIRLYWPNIRPQQSPLSHQLWLPRSLLSGVRDAAEAVDRIRRQLRRLVLGMSTFSVFEPRLIEDVRRRSRREELERLRLEATSKTDYQALADEYFDRLVAATEELDRKNVEVDDLQRQLQNLQAALRWTPSATDDGEVPAEAEVPPATVEEAVERARERFQDLLLFGSDVEMGVAGLAPEAGPPPKVLQYLEALAEMAAMLQSGEPLGNSVMGWLQDRGIAASGERELVKSNAREMQLRTWDNGCGTREEFEHHLKPNEATAPDRCVRIYFRADTDAGRVVVGWVGRHP